MNKTKEKQILANNIDLYTYNTNNNYNQSRLIVELDKNIIDDINKQIESKQKILDNDPLFSAVNDFFVNIIDVFYDLLNWNKSFIDIFFTGYRPISIAIFFSIVYLLIKLIKIKTLFN